MLLAAYRSRMLLAAIGKPNAFKYYLSDQIISANHATAVGLIDAVCSGVQETKFAAHQGAISLSTIVLQTVAAVALSHQLLFYETVAHVDCLMITGGWFDSL